MMDPLASLPFLTALDRQELHKHSNEVSFKKGDRLVEQGTELEALWVVLAGRVGVQVKGTAGSLIDVSILGPGDLFGEMSYVTGEVSSASIVGVEPGQLLRVPRSALEALTQLSAGFGGRLYRSLSTLLAQRLRDTTARLPPLMVEEVAQVRLHRSQLTGRMPHEEKIPETLTSSIEDFKLGMMAVDRRLARQRGSEAPSLQALPLEVQIELQAEVNRLCDGLIDALTIAVESAPALAEAEAYGAYALRESFAYFMRSRLCDRSYSKPRGYAGDFFTIEILYENRATGDGRLGPLIDAWALGRPVPRAVRGRRKLLAGILRERYDSHGTGLDDAYRVMSLGAGPGRELFDLLLGLAEPRREPVRPTCIDIDGEALAYSGRLARDLGLAEQFVWAKENVLRLGRGQARLRPVQHDVIYSAGLFDYLQEDVAVELLNWVYEMLEPGGLAVIGNFDVSCPDRAMLDHILDWHLLYRRPEDMLRIFERSAFGGCKMGVRWEETRINHFILAERGR